MEECVQRVDISCLHAESQDNCPAAASADSGVAGVQVRLAVLAGGQLSGKIGTVW